MGRERIAAVEAKHRKRGRPRSAEADAAIERATLELLPEHGLRGLSMEEVARRAGVSKATLYRRFPSKKELVEAALRAIRASVRTCLPAPRAAQVISQCKLGQVPIMTASTASSATRSCQFS